MSWSLILYPEAVLVNTSSFWKTEAAVTFATGDVMKLQDSTDSTYARNASGTAGTLRFSLGTWTEFSGARFKRLRVVTRQKNTVQASYLVYDNGADYLDSVAVPKASSGVISVAGPWVTKNRNGGEWLQARIDALQLECIGGGGFNDTRIMDFGVEVELQNPPDAQATVITGADGKAMQQASFSWVAGDAQDSQRKFQVKVFTQAIAEAGGFDPATAATVYDSGIRDSSYRMFTMPSYLALGTNYYVSVKVSNDFNGTNWWGAWSPTVFFTTHSATTTVVSSPSGAVINSLRPSVVWSVTDPNSDTLGAWEVKIFTAAQYGAVGFNPSTSTPTQSGSGTATYFPLWTPATPLANNTTYRAYVRTTSGVYKVQSPWAYSDFSLAVDVPTAPVTTVNTDLPRARITGVFTANANLLFPETAQQTNTLGWVNGGNATPTVELVLTDPQTRIVATAAADAWIYNHANYDIPVLPGVQYSWNIRATRVSGTGDKTVVAGVQWLTAAKAAITSVNGTSGATFAGVPVNRGGTAVAPATAAYARLYFYIFAAEAGQAFRINDAMMVVGNVSAGDLGDTAIRRTRGFAPLRHTIEASSDGGLTWRAVAGSTDSVWSWVDEAPTFNQVMQYRATSFSSVVGDEVSSAYGVTSITLPIVKVWIKDLADSTKNYSFPVSEDWLGFTRAKNRQILKGLGATKPKAVRGEADFDTFDLPILVMGDTAWAKFNALIRNNGSLLVMSPKGNRLCEVNGDVGYSEWLWDDMMHESEDARRATIPFVEVEG